MRNQSYESEKAGSSINHSVLSASGCSKVVKVGLKSVIGNCFAYFIPGGIELNVFLCSCGLEQ
jgi:hypothetical protein